MLQTDPPEVILYTVETALSHMWTPFITRHFVMVSRPHVHGATTGTCTFDMWFNFILGSKFNSPWFKLVISYITIHTQTKENKI